MGLKHFDGNEEDIMESFLKHKTLKKGEFELNYPESMKSLLRKKMIECKKGLCSITERGKSAINQQKIKGEYWVRPLKPKEFKPYGSGKISKELVGYIK